MKIPPFVAALAALVLVACTDGATRLAYELEGAAKELRRSGAASSTLQHVPSRSPEGCKGAYVVTLSPTNGLSVRSREADGGRYATSYHRRFVTIERELTIEKGPGEATVIELQKRGDEVVIVDMR